MSRNNRPMPTRSDRIGQRRGAVLFLMLTAMMVTSMLMAVWARDVIDQHRRLRSRDEALQADWLANSGLARAVARLSAAKDYTGEEWSISAKQLQRKDPALVTIRIEPVAGQPQLRTVTVIADFPNDPIRRKRKRRRAVIDLTRLGEQS